MSIKEFLTISYRSPVLAAFFTIIAPFLYSIITNRDWISIYNSIPQNLWIFLVILFVIWIISIAVRKKMMYITHPYGSSPGYGWKDLGYWSYNDVLWKARIPNPGPFSGNNKITSIDIEYEPRCPQCKTKLEENDSFYWYTWNCVNCDFKKKTWNNFIKSNARAEKYVEGQIEAQYDKKNQNRE